jgi:alkylated DNA repair dioxygenase AlkB
MSTTTLLSGPEDAKVVYLPTFCDTVTTTTQHLAAVPFDDHYVRKPFSKKGDPLVKVARRIKAYATAEGVGAYTFAGTTIKPTTPMPEWLTTLKRRAEQATTQVTGEPCTFNYALINEYPDGNATIGKHADSEPYMVAGSPIASFSAGAERDFFFHRIADGTLAKKQLLHSGSLLLMLGATQQHYHHSLPARKRITKVRYNITFRVMKNTLAQARKK